MAGTYPLGPGRSRAGTDHAPAPTGRGLGQAQPLVLAERTVTVGTRMAKQPWLYQTCSVPRTSTAAATPRQRERRDLTLLREEPGSARIHG